MAEYINLNETEVLAETGENSNLVVEEDGALKRIPAQEIGKAVSWDQLQGKPFDSPNAAHQQLVTDGDGVAKWEDKPFGVEFNRKDVIPAETYDCVVSSSRYCVSLPSYVYTLNSNKNNLYLMIESDTYNESYPLVYRGILEGTVYCWGNKSVWAGSEDTGEPFVMTVYESYLQYIYFNENPGDTVTIRVYEQNEIVSPIDSTFLPTTVPVIQSAQVGQTVVVKAVDDQGKPTEWEAVDAGGDGDTDPLIVTVSDGVASHGSNEICAEIWKGRKVMLYYDMIYPCVGFAEDDFQVVFVQFVPSSSNGFYRTAKVDTDGNVTVQAWKMTSYQ